jgi:hypothetical protein
MRWLGSDACFSPDVYLPGLQSLLNYKTSSYRVSREVCHIVGKSRESGNLHGTEMDFQTIIGLESLAAACNIQRGIEAFVRGFD